MLARVSLVVSVGGVSYAAGVLPADSVGSKQLRQNALTSPKVKHGSLLLSDTTSGPHSSLGFGAPGDRSVRDVCPGHRSQGRPRAKGRRRAEG